jgi:uncharacterized protein
MKQLVFKLRDVTDDGLDLAVELDRPLVSSAFEGVDGLDLGTTTARIEAHVSKEQQDNVFVRGQLVGVVTLACSRCVEPARVKLDSPLELSLLSQQGVEPEMNVEDDLEVAFYTGDEIDLNEVIREQLVLALPIAPVCREDCKGLCATCGTNLNLGACQCPPPEHESPFSALKSLKM